MVQVDLKGIIAHEATRIFVHARTTRAKTSARVGRPYARAYALV